MVSAELDRLDPPADLGRFGQVVLSPIRTQAMASPLLRLPPEPLCHAFNLIRFPGTDDPVHRRASWRPTKRIYHRVRDAGGTLYPASAAFPLSPAEWRDHFGPAFGLLREAKRAVRPGHAPHAGVRALHLRDDHARPRGTESHRPSPVRARDVSQRTNSMNARAAGGMLRFWRQTSATGR